jgi:outer membrane protein OmpU
MNKLIKIGVSALAGSLALTAANAIEMSVSGSAGGAYASSDDTGKTGPYQFDSVVFSASGTTDGGIDVSAKMELDNDNPATNAGMDDRSFSFGTEDMGTVTFSGHGGSSVMGQWDDVTPNAYEEVWDGTSGADVRIDGISGNNLLSYVSPTISGITFRAAYQSTAADSGSGNGKTISAYNDWGISIAPEMVEGLEVGYATGEMHESTTEAIDHTTYYIKYTYGSFTVAYQDHEADGVSASSSDESETWGVSYAVNENLSIAYGERDYDDDTSSSAAGSLEQNDSGFSASYTMGGMTIAGHMNSSDNVGGAASADRDSYEIALSFAF